VISYASLRTGLKKFYSFRGSFGCTFIERLVYSLAGNLIEVEDTVPGMKARWSDLVAGVRGAIKRVKSNGLVLLPRGRMWCWMPNGYQGSEDLRWVEVVDFLHGF
jgi:hypothetical protein